MLCSFDFLNSTMKVFYKIVLCVFLFKHVQSESSTFETEKNHDDSILTIDCHLSGSCIRLCSKQPSGAVLNLKSINGSETLKEGFSVLYGRPCENMIREIDFWELMAVSKS